MVARQFFVLFGALLLLTPTGCRKFLFGPGDALNPSATDPSKSGDSVSGSDNPHPGSDVGAYDSNPPCAGGTNCRNEKAECGTVDTKCNGLIYNCGSCTDGQICDAITKTCGIAIEQSCQSAGKNCGTISDGKGGTLDCGVCSGTSTCGGSGKPNECGCKAKTCEQLSKSCGMVDDGCGTQIDCNAETGGCAPGQECSPATNTCFFPNCEGFKSCADIVKIVGSPLCGPYPDGCGGYVDCAQCKNNEVCDRETNTCLAYPRINPNQPNSPPSYPGACGPGDSCPAGFGCVVINNGSSPASTVKICRATACGDRQCGSFTDACNVNHGCDGTTAVCQNGTQCITNACVACKQAECGPRQCGTIPDGCGGFKDCGTSKCDTANGEVCHPDLNKCIDPVPRSCSQECAAQGHNCGSVKHWDGTANGGTGGFVSCTCGSCNTAARESCGGSGYSGVCGLTVPDAECLRQKVACGEVKDPCGNTFLCQGCGVGNKCDFAPAGGRACRACKPADYKTCAVDYANQCGDQMDDGCGGLLNCRSNCGANICDSNPVGVFLNVCCMPGYEIADADDPNIDGGRPPTAGLVVGDCCLPTPESRNCTGFAPFCGVREDSCGVSFTCDDCSSGVCDLTGGNVQNRCCPVPAAGHTAVIAQANATPDVDTGGHFNSYPGGTGLPVVADDCCEYNPGDQNTKKCDDYRGGPEGPRRCVVEDNCGRDINCGCPGAVCDTTGAPNWNICCQPGQVISTTANWFLTDGVNGVPNGTPPSSIEPNECCNDEAVQSSCWGDPAPATTHCRQVESRCGNSVDCRTISGAVDGCPSGRLCDAGSNQCCLTTQILGLAITRRPGAGADGKVLDYWAIDAKNTHCCTELSHDTTCRVGNTGGGRTYCSVLPTTTKRDDYAPPWEHNESLDRENNCGVDQNCGECAGGGYCSLGDESSVTNSPNNHKYRTVNRWLANTNDNSVVPVGECCVDMTNVQVCENLGCGTFESICGRNVNCGTCSGGTACDLNSKGQYGVCCSAGEAISPNTGDCCAPTCTSGVCGINSCGLADSSCGCGTGQVCDGTTCCTPKNPTCGPNDSCPTSTSLDTGCHQPPVTCSCPTVCDNDPDGSNNDVCCAPSTNGRQVVIAERDDMGAPNTVQKGDCCEVDPATYTCPANFCGPIEDNCGRNFDCSGACGWGIACDSNGPQNSGTPTCCASGQVIFNGDCCTRSSSCASGTKTGTIQKDPNNPGSAESFTAQQCSTGISDGCGGTRSCACASGACNMSSPDANNYGYCCPTGLSPVGNTCQCPLPQVYSDSTKSCCTPSSLDITCNKSSGTAKCGRQTNNCGQTVDCGTGYCTEDGGYCDGGTCQCQSNDYLCGFKKYCNVQNAINPCTNQVFNCNGCPPGAQ